MTRDVVTARNTKPSSRSSDTSQESSGGPHTPSTYIIANMHLLHKKSVDVANDLDLFVYDSSDHELNSEAEYNSHRGRARDNKRRNRSFLGSPGVVAELKELAPRRRRSSGTKANVLRKVKGEAELEAQRQQDAQDDYDTADFITVPPSYLARKDRWTILPDRQGHLSSPTTLLIPGTKTLPSILRGPRDGAIDVATEPVPRLTFARRPSNTEGSDSLSPAAMYVSSSRTSASPSSPRGTRRLSFVVDPTNPANVRRRSKTTTKATGDATTSGNTDNLRQTPRSLATTDLALGSPTSSISSYTSTEPSSPRRSSASASSILSLSIGTSIKSKAAFGSRSFSGSPFSSSPILFLPTRQTDGTSAGFSPTRRLSSASATVTLCKACATYHPPSYEGNAGEGDNRGKRITSPDVHPWGVTATATTRRRSLPEILLYASGAKSGSEESNRFAGLGGRSDTTLDSSRKIGSIRGRSTGRGRSESDTRALLWSIQASAGKIL